MADTIAKPEITEVAKPETRDAIAKLVIYSSFSLVGILILVFLILFACPAYSEDKFKGFQYILGTLIPLLGTWVGAVIAFYFTKENFKAASDSMQNVIKNLSSDDKLKSLLVKDVMRKFSDIKQYPNFTKDTLLKDIIAFMNSETGNINRLPIFGAGDLIQYCIHQSIFEKFISDHTLNPKPAPADGSPVKTADTLTFNDLLANTDIIDSLKNSIALVKSDANLLEAKQQMDKLPNCQDVFVTEDGTSKTRVLGWITNNTIMENSKV